MKQMAWLEPLFAHMHWADQKVWDAVLQTSAAASDVRLRKLFYHIHLTQTAFLHIWTGQGMDFPQLETFADLDAIRQWGKQYYKDLNVWLNGSDAMDFDANIIIPWASQVEKRLGRKVGATTVAESMQQVAFHSTYHRGQVNARLRELGGEPPLVDFIAWLWHGKPEAE